MSDYAAWMPRRNDGYFLKRGGETKPWGAFSFGSFSLGKQRKGTRQEAKNLVSGLLNVFKFIMYVCSRPHFSFMKAIHSFHPSGQLRCAKLLSCNFVLTPKKSNQKKRYPAPSCLFDGYFLPVLGEATRDRFGAKFEVFVFLFRKLFILSYL
ncbi:hypothetical protein [Cellvibrio zantedeschiae]|uniref:hypothetical protein n=1 Tax=Cellvibrio zantedeschiae TaxID=1237077 RepID=UPI001671C200|nr:hypothetical protein [Cellvibrio zantedeschiae]